ncbi:MAG: EH signature domain-containing protein [Snowella sp.]|nr:EH signature domain-containing protein [Snowella sp.]
MSKFYFSQLKLPEITNIEANQLKELAGLSGKQSALKAIKVPEGVPHLPNKHPRTINEIMEDIENKNFQNINFLEWIYCIYKKSEWDKINPEKSDTTSQFIWNYSQNNNSLKQLLFWNLILYINKQQTSTFFPQSLTNTFSKFIPQTQIDKVTCSIINALFSKLPQVEITKIAWQCLVTPYQLFLDNQLPTKISIIDESLKYATLYFIEIATTNIHLITQNHISWLLNCFQEMSDEQRLYSVESILCEIPAEIGGKYPKLVEWLRNNYGFNSANSRWSELSSNAKFALQKWIGAVNYNDFSNLVNEILNCLDKSSKDFRQLRSRRVFWSNYSDRFSRIRILLPESASLLSNNSFKNQEFAYLKNDGSEPTEICIFDFGEYFVVEFFRGKGSETRLFKNSAETNKFLFINSELSVKKIRALGGEAHDHCTLWQVACNHWLLERNIHPNQGLKLFKRVNASDSYDPKYGLTYPSGEERQKRERQVEQWRRTMRKLEDEAKNYVLWLAK